MKSTENPLVSIIVITYNSAKYVLETLESAKAQTYQNIELIVSDDCSTDTTVEVCRKWIEDNKDRFVRADLITVLHNTGTPANCNRGINAANGEWIKYMAGDDLLVPDAIECVVGFLIKNRLDSVITRFKSFSNESATFKSKVYPNEEIVDYFFKINSFEQYKILASRRLLLILGLYINKNLLHSIGGFDENYELIEDLPLLLRITKNGNKLSYFQKITVLYRIHSCSVTGLKNKEFPFNRRFINNMNRIYIDLLRQDIPIPIRLYNDFRFWVYNIIVKYNIKSRLLIRIILRFVRMVSPHKFIDLYNRLKKVF